jgi:trimeric autotransporter adhesin
MRALALALFTLFATPGCSKILGLDNVTRPYFIGGQVRGLWDGTDGVVLRLEADGVETLLTVSANGAFSFAKQFETGTSYTVTVVANPVHHSCAIDAGGNGTVEGADILKVSVACSLPGVVIALSGQWGWAFDPTQDTQMFAGSIAAQEVRFMVNGSSLTGATVDGAAVTLGETTAPVALPLGSTTLPLVLTANGKLSKTYQMVFDRSASVLDQVVYGKASNPGVNDEFSYSVALSGDTLAVGARSEPSTATGINGNQDDDNGFDAGAVYVFVRTGTKWMQQAYVKASNTGFGGDRFGVSVALSGDTLAVGAPFEASAATGTTGTTGEQADDSAAGAGAVYVFVRTEATWTQQAYVKASNTEGSDEFGSSVALSGDTLAVGAPKEDSGVGGNQSDNTASGAGAVYMFVRSGGTWAQQAYVKALNTRANDGFGTTVALSGDTLAVGAPNEANSAGAVYTFVRSTTAWAQQAYIKASNAGTGDRFGSSVALSGDTLAVGAPKEGSARGELDNTATAAGAVYVFVRSGTMWAQQAYIKASNTEAYDEFGTSVALSGDTLAVGAPFEDSAATGVDGDQANNSASYAGAVYIFVRSGTMWAQQAYVKASNTETYDLFGYSVALSGDTLAVGALKEGSAATGINGDQADNGAGNSGAVYVFR